MTLKDLSVFIAILTALATLVTGCSTGFPPAVPSPSPAVGDGVLDVPPAASPCEGEVAAAAAGGIETPSPTPNPEPDYVLNLNTGKFHYPDCSSVEQIKPDNYEAFTGSREEVLAQGFVPCKNCNP